MKMEATLDNCVETGSDPHGMARISIKLKIAARLAQSVEHESLNHRIIGLIPRSAQLWGFPGGAIGKALLPA